MSTALIHGMFSVEFNDVLREELDKTWTIHAWDPAKNDLAEFEQMAHEADAVIGGKIPTEIWPEAPKLKLVQIPWTGHEFCSPETMPRGIPVCNCFEHESTIAEYVLATMLEFKIDLRGIDARFRREGWRPGKPAATVFHGEIRGSTLGIVGYGHIGRELAKRAKAFDMRIVATRRSVQRAPELLDWLGTPDRLHDLLRESDFVVVACDLNSVTKGMIGEKELEIMKPDSFIINISRGRVIAEEPLYNALKNRTIAGAAIDVWYNYVGSDGKSVWPSNLPFQDLDNVILSAHESALTKGQVSRRWRFVAENINRAVRGEPLANVVFIGKRKVGT